MKLIRTRTIWVHKEHFLYAWCETITQKANNLKNAVRFRQRQVLTARKKGFVSLSANEQDVLDEIKSVNGIDMTIDDQPVTNKLLYHLMQDSKNPDYYSDGLPVQSAQWIIKRVVQEMNDYYAALASYKVNPNAFTGKPELPGYCRKGGHTTVGVTNQDCSVTVDSDGNAWIGLPLAKKNPINIGYVEGRLKEVKVVPSNGSYKLQFTFEETGTDHQEKQPRRIASVDFGVNNLMAVTNNVGAECLLYKGGIVKSINQYYNKTMAEIMAEEMAKPGCPLNKDGKPTSRQKKV